MTEPPPTTVSTPRRLINAEADMWRSLARWIIRRPNPQQPTVSFSYTGAIMGLIITIIAVSAIEIPIVHYLLRAWPIPQTIALVLGMYGLFWMFALLASLRVNPHTLDDHHLKLRFGASFQVTVPLDSIAHIRVQNHSLPEGKDIQTIDTPDGTHLHIAVAKQTNIDLDLNDQLTVTMPNGSTQQINRLSVYTDQPHALLETTNAARHR